ncbi:MAG: hypothetical protein HC869_22265 [Rhodospirillales bacterium]|nr:hypothetical protein [Rhodospirillales bacterium]
METFYTYAGNSVYFFQAILAFVGAYALIMVWRRVAGTEFDDEEEPAGRHPVGEHLERSRMVLVELVNAPEGGPVNLRMPAAGPKIWWNPTACTGRRRRKRATRG